MRAAIFAAACAALVVGCGSNPPKTAKSARPPVHATTTTTSGAIMPGKVSSQIAVSGEIAKACDLHSPPPSQVKGPNAAPHFDFDQSALHDDDRMLLSEVAKCFTTGPLKGHEMRLTGRADPRGEAEYNMNLGAERASAVKEYLNTLGVAPGVMQATSRGELDAVGTDEATWARDRRVDIDVAK